MPLRIVPLSSSLPAANFACGNGKIAGAAHGDLTATHGETFHYYILMTDFCRAESESPLESVGCGSKGLDPPPQDLSWLIITLNIPETEHGCVTTQKSNHTCRVTTELHYTHTLYLPQFLIPALNGRERPFLMK